MNILKKWIEAIKQKAELNEMIDYYNNAMDEPNIEKQNELLKAGIKKYSVNQ